jgi:ABC-type nitrate/sulfonate/bicarbonate transport system substrate-binding protein
VLVKLLQDRGFARDDYELIEVGGWQSRYESLMDGRISATLLPEPFIDNSLCAGGHLLARDFEMIPTYHGTCGAASRSWAERNPDRMIRYIRAYVEATEWCFASENRPACLDMLARHNDIQGRVAERTLDALLDPRHGLYPRAAVNLPGVLTTIELRAELGYLAQPSPPAEKSVELFYYRNALAIAECEL